eukprot:1714795-Rhodomonas_salina.3
MRSRLERMFIACAKGESGWMSREKGRPADGGPIPNTFFMNRSCFPCECSQCENANFACSRCSTLAARLRVVVSSCSPSDVSAETDRLMMLAGVDSSFGKGDFSDGNTLLSSCWDNLRACSCNAFKEESPNGAFDSGPAFKDCLRSCEEHHAPVQTAAQLSPCLVPGCGVAESGAASSVPGARVLKEYPGTGLI